MKTSIIIFKEDKIRDAIINEPIDTNFERNGIKKLMEDRLEKNNFSCNKVIETFTIKIEYNKVGISIHVYKKVMIERAQIIKRLTRWNNLVDGITMRAYLISKHSEKVLYNTSINVKKRKTDEEEEVEEPINKKKVSSSRKAIPKDRLTSNTRQEVQFSTSHLRTNISFQKEK